jgi:hypothetical protein
VTTGLKVGLNFAHGTSHKEYLTASVSNNLTSGDKLTISTNYVSSTASPGIELDAWTESSGTDLTITVGSGNVSGGDKDDDDQDDEDQGGDGQGGEDQGGGAEGGDKGDGEGSNQVPQYTAGSMYKSHVLIVSVENGNLLLMGTQSTPEADLSSYMDSDEELRGKWVKPTKAQWETILSVLGGTYKTKEAFNAYLSAKDQDATQVNSSYYYAIDDDNEKYYIFAKEKYESLCPYGSTSAVYPVAVIPIPSTGVTN